MIHFFFYHFRKIGVDDHTIEKGPRWSFLYDHTGHPHSKKFFIFIYFFFGGGVPILILILILPGFLMVIKW